MDDMAGDTTKVPALGVSFRTLLDREGRREIVFQTHVDQETSTSELNEIARSSIVGYGSADRSG